MGNILNRGEIINETYTVRFYIGKGAFGEVYRVEHKYLGTQVLKVILKEAFSQKDVKAVIEESLILSKLSHPNILRVFDANAFTKDSRTYHFITTEFISGETLDDLLKRKIKLKLPKAIKIQKDILSGLQVVHSNIPPIIHRDLKPDNILLSYENTLLAKLSDFGIAVRINNASSIANAGGTLPFLASECFFGACTRSSDIFSAGIVLYRMLTGMLPWEYNFDPKTKDPEEISTMVLSARKKKPIPPSYFNNDCSEALDKVILKSIEVNLELRYKDAKEFNDALGEAVT